MHGKGKFIYSDGTMYLSFLCYLCISIFILRLWLISLFISMYYSFYLTKKSRYFDLLRYNGQFVDDKPQGPGTYTFTYGTVQTGNYTATPGPDANNNNNNKKILWQGGDFTIRQN